MASSVSSVRMNEGTSPLGSGRHSNRIRNCHFRAIKKWMSTLGSSLPLGYSRICITDEIANPIKIETPASTTGFDSFKLVLDPHKEQGEPIVESRNDSSCFQSRTARISRDPSSSSSSRPKTNGSFWYVRFWHRKSVHQRYNILSNNNSCCIYSTKHFQLH